VSHAHARHQRPLITISPKQISIRDLLRKFKAKGVVYIYMAVLMGYRVLVMGHNVSTSQICQYVFHFLPSFACLLGSAK
jgi:hypothetical protein